MSAFSAALRIRVNERAGHRCEYCHLPCHGQVATFPLDHVIPKSAGGRTEVENLAQACPHCNAQKWNYVEAFDSITGTSVRLFNPRQDDWNEQFEWSTDRAELIGKTAIGRATISLLEINAADMIELHRLLIRLQLMETTGK